MVLQLWAQPNRKFNVGRERDREINEQRKKERDGAKELFDEERYGGWTMGEEAVARSGLQGRKDREGGKCSVGGRRREEKIF